MTVETNYAEEMFEAASKRQCLERVLEEISAVTHALEGHEGILRDPSIRARDHKDWFASALTGQVHALTLSFLFLLADKRRLTYLPGIVRRFGTLVREAAGESRVRLYTPYDLDAPALDSIRLYLARRGLIGEETAHKVSFEVILDKSLLGGFRAECRGRALDESIKTRLLEIREVHR